MQGIYTHIPETNNVHKEYNVAASLSLLYMVPISLVPVLTLIIIIIIIIVIINMLKSHGHYIYVYTHILQAIINNKRSGFFFHIVYFIGMKERP
jgi:hypothetical protein